MGGYCQQGPWALHLDGVDGWQCSPDTASLQGRHSRGPLGEFSDPRRFLRGRASLYAGPGPSEVHQTCKTAAMAIEGEGVARLVTLVEAYGRHIAPAVLDQHQAGAIASPLAIWLLLAASAGVAPGGIQSYMEEALGCSTAEANMLLQRFLDRPLSPSPVRWPCGRDAPTSLRCSSNWSASLPSQVERGPVPSQTKADAWADRNSQGLITKFPLEISRDTRLLLSSVMATKVRWQRSFKVVPAAQNLRETSPWRSLVNQVLLDHHGVGSMMLVSTESAGVVAAHIAVGHDDLAVISVAADPALPREEVLEAAYEVTRLCREDHLESARCSLFDLPLGHGHSWRITQHDVPTFRAGDRSESISGAVLAAWCIKVISISGHRSSSESSLRSGRCSVSSARTRKAMTPWRFIRSRRPIRPRG